MPFAICVRISAKFTYNVKKLIRLPSRLNIDMRKDVIVVADDDTDDLQTLAEAFAEAGYLEPLVFARNGLELLDYLTVIANEQKTKPAFILLDLNMPKLSGIETLARLKSNPVFKPIPVIVYSTASDKSTIDKAYSAGANSFIVKAPNWEGIMKNVSNILEYRLNTAIIPV